MIRARAVPPALVLLGPQRLRPIIGAAADAIGVRGRVAVVTAGWEEREEEDEELRAALGREATNLRLHARTETLLEAHPELLAAHHRRRDRRDEARALYRLRLDALTEVAQSLLARTAGDDAILAETQTDVLEDARHLDVRHLDRMRRIRDEGFAEPGGAHDHPAVRAARAEVAAIIAECDAVAVAGGHLRILLDCMTLLGLPAAMRGKPVIAWSAGAMILGERIVLFHDATPQGPRSAEAYAPGLGFHEGVLPLPHARRRLRLDDHTRCAILSRRFAPLRSAVMDEGAWIRFEQGRLVEVRETRLIDDAGAIVPFPEPEPAAP